MGESVRPTSLVTTNDAVIIVGTFSGTMDADPAAESESLHTAAGSADAFAISLDPETGALQWVATLPCTGEATVGHTAIDASGNLLLAGGFTGTIDLDPGAADTADAAVGGSDGFVVALDSTGAHSWSTVIGGSGDDRISASQSDGSGGVAIAGGISGTVVVGGQTLISAGGVDCFAARVEPDGSACGRAHSAARTMSPVPTSR